MNILSLPTLTLEGFLRDWSCTLPCSEWTSLKLHSNRFEGISFEAGEFHPNMVGIDMSDVGTGAVGRSSRATTSWCPWDITGKISRTPIASTTTAISSTTTHWCRGFRPEMTSSWRHTRPTSAAANSCPWQVSDKVRSIDVYVSLSATIRTGKVL